MTENTGELERVCGNCNYSFPAEPGGSEFAICLKDPEIKPFMDDLLDRQDFSRCRELVRQKRFDWRHEACEEFDPVEDAGLDFPESPELLAEIKRLADSGQLTIETLETALLADAVDRIDWSKKPIDDDLK